MIVENMFLFVPGRPVQIPRDYGTTSCGRCHNIVYRRIRLVNCNKTSKRLSGVLPSVGFQATSMLDELCTLDVFPQRKLTHSLKPPCSMRNTLNTAIDTGLQNRKYLWNAFFPFFGKMSKNNRRLPFLPATTTCVFSLFSANE